MLQKRPEVSPVPAPSLLTTIAENKMLGCGINLIVIPLLLILILILPPLSLPERILDAGYRTVGKNGVDLKAKTDALLSVAPEGMDGITTTVKVKFEAVQLQRFLDGKAGAEMQQALSALSPALDVRSDVYQIGLKGTSPKDIFVSLPIPDDAEPYSTLDLYAWDGTKWDFVPARFFEDIYMSEATLSKLPKLLVIAQTKQTPPVVSAEMANAFDIPKAGGAALVEVNPLGLIVRQDGSISGQMIRVTASQNYIVVPTLSNLEGGVARSDLVTNMIANDRARKAHIAAISDFVVQNLMPGVDIQYLGLKPDVREYFSKFIEELSAELHARGKLLTVSVPTPTPVTEDDWDTGAYDWGLIGQLADGIKIPSMTTPNAYQNDGPMDKLLTWAVTRVSRYKIQIALDAGVQDRVGNQLIVRSYDEIVKSLIGKVQVEGLTEEYAIPWQGVTFKTNLAPGFAGFKQDAATKALYFNYQDSENKQHQVYVETAESLTFKMKLASKYNLKGVHFRGLLNSNTDAALWTAIDSYSKSAKAAVASTVPQYEVVWTVVDGKGQTIQTEKRPLNQPQFVWTAAPVPDQYKIGAALSTTGKGTANEPVAINVAIPTATPTPTPLPPTPTPIPADTPTPRPTRPPQQAQAPAQPSVPNSAPNPNFAYGIQTDPQRIAPGDIKNINFQWVKWQMPWSYVEGSQGAIGWSGWDGRIDQYAGNGIKIMLSIVKSPRWARPPNTNFGVEGPPADPQTYVNFVAAVAARYKGKVQAIEIWNEQNLHYEWGDEPIDPRRYMDLLCKSYAAIKAANPEMIVVSGALTPTGAPAPLAMDDAAYLIQMYNNGLRNCADAIGAHPSGYANPPDQLWQGGRVFGYDDHRSFFFRNTMEEYRRIMVANGDGNKKIWPTEFGWPVWRFTGDARFVFAQRNNLDVQAQYTVKAYQMMKSWGWVGVAFLWNLDYGVTQPGSELANFSALTTQGATPLYNALGSMPK